MTGTASTYYDFTDTDNNNYKSRNIDLFSAWLFGKVNTDCLLTDISRSGTAVLIPIKNSTPSQILDLLIMSPENKDEILTIIRVEQRWIDVEFSDEYKKIGLEFQNIDLLNLRAIDSLIELFIQQKNTNIKCNLLNC